MPVRALTWRHTARLLYGSIVGLAIVLALQEHPPADAAIAATLVGTAIAVALAEVYSDVLGTEIERRRSVTRDDVRHIAGRAEATAVGVAFPAVFFVLAAADVLGTQSAFNAAKWSGVALVSAYAFAATRLAGASMPRSSARAVAFAVLGVALVTLKSLVH